MTETQIINIHVLSTLLTLILPFPPAKFGALPILQECPTTPQMASRVAGQNRVAEEGASDGERSKALEGEVDLKFCCAPAPHGRTTKPFSPSLYVTTLETIAFRSNVSLEQLFHSLLNAF